MWTIIIFHSVTDRALCVAVVIASRYLLSITVVIKKAVAVPKAKLSKEERLKQLGLEHLVDVDPPEKKAAKAAAKAHMTLHASLYLML